MKIIRNALNLDSMSRALKACLPRQGSIEVQRDEPGKIHPLHDHPTDETIVVLEGQLCFLHADQEILCMPGDAILLPARTSHGSIAMQQGAMYIIALRTLEFS